MKWKLHGGPLNGQTIESGGKEVVRLFVRWGLLWEHKWKPLRVRSKDGVVMARHTRPRFIGAAS